MDRLIARMEDPGKRSPSPMASSTEEPLTLVAGMNPSINRAKKKILRRETHTPENTSSEESLKPSGSEMEEPKPETIPKTVEIPTIRVNNEPIEDQPKLVRQQSQPNLVALGAKANGHRESATLRSGKPDYTSANTGMFSDHIFNESTADGLIPRQNELPFMDTNTDNPVKLTPFAQAQNEAERSGRHHRRHHSGSSELSRRSRASTLTNVTDKKRLVNQFLESVEAPSTLQLRFPDSLAAKRPKQMYNTSNFSSTGHSTRSSDTHMTTANSFQSLLYHDLENPSKPSSASLYKSGTNSKSTSSSMSTGLLSSESSSSSSSYTSSESSTMSSSSTKISSSSLVSDNNIEDVGMSTDEVDDNNTSSSGAGNGTDLSLSCNEIDYYQRHIAIRLKKSEALMKENLRDIILKRENDLHNNLQNFDTYLHDLKKLKYQIISLQKLVRNDYLVILKEDFDVNNKNSFENHLTEILNKNVTKLQDLERRMESSGERLNEQKETMKRMENLINLENSLKLSQKNASWVSKNKAIVYDLSLIHIFS